MAVETNKEGVVTNLKDVNKVIIFELQQLYNKLDITWPSLVMQPHFQNYIDLGDGNGIMIPLYLLYMSVLNLIGNTTKKEEKKKKHPTMSPKKDMD